MKHKIICGNCIEELKKLPENSVDACVTDPPYKLNFMNRKWDSSGISFKVELWEEVYRVPKPGAHILVAGIARTHHRMWVALEDAGFNIKDGVYHIFGSGFPKSVDISKQIDKRGGYNISWFGEWLRKWREETNITQKEVAKLFLSKNGGLTGCVANWELGLNLPTADQFSKIVNAFDLPFKTIEAAEREIIGKDGRVAKESIFNIGIQEEWDLTNPKTKEARKYEGFGTALKPAVEIWCLAQKPISERNIASNVLRWGVGGLDIDGCRIGNDIRKSNINDFSNIHSNKYGSGAEIKTIGYKEIQGRFPANLILECCCEDDELVEGKEIRSGNFPMDRGNSAFFGTSKEHKHHIGEVRDKTVIHKNPNCVCAMLDEQSGVLDSGGPARHPERNYKRGRKESDLFNFGEGSTLHGYDSKGGASRFFKTIKVDQDNSFICDECILNSGIERCGNILISERADGILNGVIKEVERYIQDTEQFLCGKKRMENFQRDMTSTISTLIRQMTELKTYNVCQEENINYYMEESEKTINLLMELNIEDAKNVKNIRFLLSFRNVLQALIRDIVKNARKRNYKNGEMKTENTITNICGNTTENTGLKAKSFFYQPKASQNERYFYCTICKQAYPMKLRDNHIHNAPENEKYKFLEFHPTQKPLQLIQYLVRLITPPDGTVLDPFLGTGTLLVASEKEDFNSIGIDSNLEYCEIAAKRLKSEMTQLRINRELSVVERIGF